MMLPLFTSSHVSQPLNNSLAVMADSAFYFCAYEFAIKAVNSPWCQLFDEDDAKVGVLVVSYIHNYTHVISAMVLKR